MTHELSFALSELQGEKSESWKFKIMEEIHTKHMHLKMESEKREQVLLNSIMVFTDKIDT